MGDDEAALLRLWREKRGEVEPEDLSGNLIVQLGLATEELNRRWYEANTGQVITDVQRQVRHPTRPVDGGDARRPGRGDRGGVRSEIHAALVVLGGSGRREVYGPAAAQHVGRGVTGRRCSRSSPGAASGSRSPSRPIRSTSTCCSPPRGSSGAASRAASPFACSASSRGDLALRPFTRSIWSSSNAWAEFAGVFRRTRSAFLEHEQAKAELKSLMPEDAKEAIGHGVRAKRSKSGAVSFDLLGQEGSHAAI